MAELPSPARAALARLVPSALHTGIAAEYLPGGYSNTNYRIRLGSEDLVLRVVNPLRVTPGIVREREHSTVTGVARTLGPPLVAYALPEGHMLTRWVEGRRLDEANPSPAALARFLMRIQRTVQTLPTAYRLDAVLPTYAREATARGAALPSSVLRALDNLQPYEHELTACHNDLNPWNVIAPAHTPSSWVVLDWEFAGMGDPWFELTVLAFGLHLDHLGYAELIDAYAALSGLHAPDPGRRRDLHRTFLLREFLWAQLQAVMGNDRAEVASQLAATEAHLSALG